MSINKGERNENYHMKQVLYDSIDMLLEKLERQNKEMLELNNDEGGNSKKKE